MTKQSAIKQAKRWIKNPTPDGFTHEIQATIMAALQALRAEPTGGDFVLRDEDDDTPDVTPEMVVAFMLVTMPPAVYEWLEHNLCDRLQLALNTRLPQSEAPQEKCAICEGHSIGNECECSNGLHSKIDIDIEDALGRELTMEESQIVGLAIDGVRNGNTPEWWKDIEWLARLRSKVHPISQTKPPTIAPTAEARALAEEPMAGTRSWGRWAFKYRNLIRAALSAGSGEAL